MHWIVFFVISVISMLGAAVFAFIVGKSRYKSGRILDPSKILFIGVIVSSVFLFIPVYLHALEESGCGIIETIFIAVHNMIRLFIVDGEFDFITQNISGLPEGLFRAYSVMFSVLFVLAPVLTFSFVLSFFKNVSAHKRYITHYNHDVYIFSELNESSLALAESLERNKSKKRLLVFTDVFEKDEETSFELLERAKELGAICFKKDIVTINFSFHSSKSEMNFFAIGQDQSENLSQALKLVEKMKYRDNVKLYVFSTQLESEMLLSNAFNQDDNASGKEKKIKVRRVNEVRSLINRNLYEKGFEYIFESAYPADNGFKNINAVVIGMGQHGTEMTKALSWFCQMDGYRAHINCFDRDKAARSAFTSLCPELMAPRFNGVFDMKGETQYEISIHSDIDVHTKEFDDMIAALPRTTYVFVALGNDELNISTAVKLRLLFARLGYYPKIQAVVYNTDKKEALTDISNFKKQKYDIDFIGDLRSSYSENVIIDSDVEDKALERHIKWGSEKEFWQYDYNYNSSIASAIHKEMKKKCNIPGIDKEPDDRTEEERWPLRELEHRRWNAYMRSEGYIYGGTIEPEGRNDIAKMHNFLVPFDKLPLKEQMKDDD